MRQQARPAAATLAATAAFDARRVWADDGSRSATDWISARARLPRGEVRADVRLGRRLRVMPQTCDALRAGAIGVAHVHKLAALAGSPRTAAAFPDGEPLLVANAAAMRFDDFGRTCDHWRDAADPDGPEHRAARDHDLRRVDLAAGLDGVGPPRRLPDPAGQRRLRRGARPPGAGAVRGRLGRGPGRAGRRRHGRAPAPHPSAAPSRRPWSRWRRGRSPRRRAASDPGRW